MSGVSLAVAPRSDPSPPNPEETDTRKAQFQQQSFGGVMGSLRVIELQLVAFIMVFSASGLVPLIDLVFPAFASAYFLILSRFVFPSRSRSSSSSSSSTADIFQGGRFFRLYVAVGTSVGLFLPLAYVLGGFARGDDQAVRSATPHLFLLSFQILTENVINGLSLFSPPVRALVPLLYTVRRIFVILDWIAVVWRNKTITSNAEFKDLAWFWFGRILAAANVLYFSINLFGFLIPQFLPKAFERYFMERERVETRAKMEEEKRMEKSSKTTSSPQQQQQQQQPPPPSSQQQPVSDNTKKED